jgi:pyrroloquinoline quinone biosynthesis protein D
MLSRQYRLQWEEAQQRHVLLFPEGMVQLNQPAAEILTRCSPPCSVNGLIGDLQLAFPDATDLAADVYEFLSVAHQKGWIEFA